MALSVIPPPLQHPVIGQDGKMTVPWASYFQSITTAIDTAFGALTPSSVGLGNVQNVDQTDADNLASGTVALERLPDAAKQGYSLMGYAVNAGALVDGQTLYWGGNPTAAATTAAGVSSICIPKTGTITAVLAWAYASSAVGSAENWPLYIRLNDTTDYLVTEYIDALTYRKWSNTGMSVPVVAGDVIELKNVNPTWATNPNTVAFGAAVYIT